MNLNFDGTNARRLTDAQAMQAVQTATFTIDVQPYALDTETVSLIMDGTVAINNLLNRATTGGVYRMWVNLWPVAVDRVNSPWYANPYEIVSGDLIALSNAFMARWGADQQSGWFTSDGMPRNP